MKLDELPTTNRTNRARLVFRLAVLACRAAADRVAAVAAAVSTEVVSLVVIALPVICRDRALDVPPQHEVLVGECESEAEEEEDHSEGTSVTQLRVLETALEHGDRHRVRGIQRSARRHHPDHVEQLQRAD